MKPSRTRSLVSVKKSDSDGAIASNLKRGSSCTPDIPSDKRRSLSLSSAAVQETSADEDPRAEEADGGGDHGEEEAMEADQEEEQENAMEEDQGEEEEQEEEDEMVKKAKEITNDAECQAAIQDVHRKLSQVVSKQEKLNEAVQNVGELMENAPNLTIPKNRNKAKEQQHNLVKAAESQETYLRGLLEKLQRINEYEFKRDMHKIGHNRCNLMKLLSIKAHSLPLWVNSVKEIFPQAGVGAIPFPESKPLELGDWAATLHGDNWIIAEVVAVQGNNKYEVLDLDTSEQETKFTLGRKRLIPLPKYRADPRRDIHALFPLEAIVLAMYPQTTCFYKGVIVKVPATPIEDYQVSFEDNTFATGYSPPASVPQHYVVAFKEIKSKKKARNDDD